MPDVNEPSGLFWAAVLGAAIGVVAGTCVQYLFELLKSGDIKKRQVRALIKEYEYNKALVDELQKEIVNLRNAINGGVLDSYSGYFPFSKAFFHQTNSFASSGLLHELFSVEEMIGLQRVTFLLSVGNEAWVREGIERRSKAAKEATLEAPFDQREGVQFVTFVESQLNELHRLIDRLIGTLRDNL
jgi:hypothetical protein